MRGGEEVGPEVEIVARLPDGRPVAARRGRLLATAFHPELTDDPVFHRYFVDTVAALPIPHPTDAGDAAPVG